MHKGNGGGLSDMFGGGISSSVASSGVAERNLNRLTIGLALIWTLSIIAIGLIVKFSWFDIKRGGRLISLLPLF